MDEIRKALELGREYVLEVLAEHDAKYQRHPATETERAMIYADQLIFDEAIASLSQPEGETRANLVSQRKLGQLLELIDKLCRLGNGEYDGNSTGNVIAQEARAILLAAEPAPSSEKALYDQLLSRNKRRHRAMAILRNPWGVSSDEIKQAQLFLCDEVEHLIAAYENLRDFANASGLDTAASSPAPSESEVKHERS